MKQITILRGSNWAITAGNLIDQLKKIDHSKDWKVEIAEYKGNRSVLQNNLMWLWLTSISNWWLEVFGEARTPETFKIYFQNQFLGKNTTEIMGETITTLIGTSDLNTKEFTEFLNNIEHYAGSEFSINLPIPNYYGEAME